MKKYNNFLLGTLFFIFILLSILSPDRFLSVNNLQTIAFQIPEFGIITLGMMIVILTGGINLSITATSALSGIMVALFLTNYSLGELNIFLLILGAVVIAFITSLVTGLINGLIVAYIGVTSILVTIGSRSLFQGISLKFTRGGSISGFPEQFYFFGNETFLGIPIPMIIFLVIIIITYFLLERTPWGERIYMVGSNPTAAKFSGIDIKKILLQVYIYSSIMAGVASIIMISRYNTAKVTLGSSYLLQSVAASVLGGTNIAGGEGSVLGTIIAVAILQLISNGLNVLGVNRFIIDITMGGILILVLTVNYFTSHKSLSLMKLFKSNYDLGR